MCKIVEDYTTQKMKEARAEGELMKAVEMINNLVDMGVSFEIALKSSKIDLKTYKKYSDNN